MDGMGSHECQRTPQVGMHGSRLFMVACNIHTKGVLEQGARFCTNACLAQSTRQAQCRAADCM